MSEYLEHNPSDHEDPSPGPTWLVGFIGAVLMLVITFGVTALFYGAKTEEETRKFIEAPYAALESMREDQARRLAVRRVEEREEGGTRYDALVIPIDQAMALTVEEHGTTR